MNATESEEWPDWAMFRISYAELEQLINLRGTNDRSAVEPGRPWAGLPGQDGYADRLLYNIIQRSY